MKKVFFDRNKGLLLLDGVMSIFEGRSKAYAFFGHLKPFEDRWPVVKVSNSNPLVMSVPGNDLKPGDEVFVHELGGIEVPGPQEVLFSDGINVTLNVDVSDQGTYLGGGYVSRVSEVERELSESQIIDNIVGLQVIRPTQATFAITEKPWRAGKEYHPGDYVNVGKDTFVCIRGSGVSSLMPVDGKELSDGYLWKLVYQPTAEELSRFSGLKNLVPVSRVYTKEESARWKARYGSVGGEITSIEMTSLGSGYSQASTTVSIHGDGKDAEAVPVFVGDDLVDIVVTKGGIGYTWAVVSIHDASGTGLGATAEARISPLRGYGFDIVSDLRPEWVVIEGFLGREPDGPGCVEEFPVGVDVRMFGIILNPTMNGVPLKDSCVVIEDFVGLKNVSGKIDGGDVVRGSTSGVEAVVLSNAGNGIYVAHASGRFLSEETIVGPRGTATVFNHVMGNSSLWGDVLYYSTTSPVRRVKEQTERFSVAVKVL